MTTRILVVDDDPAVRAAVSRALRVDYEVDEAVDGADALAKHAASPADAIVLDLLMPQLGGLDVCRALRRRDDPVPVLVVTARDAVDDRVEGLDAGADDYLVKPFAYEELAARLRALGRRGATSRRPEPKLAVGPIVLDETSRRVTLDGKSIDLSPREFSLLECLLRHPGQTLSRDQLLDQAWPFSVAVTPNAVDAYVHYLRDKLGSAGKLIETVRGVGYRLADA
jgi:two-component system response regulator MprA